MSHLFRDYFVQCVYEERSEGALRKPKISLERQHRKIARKKDEFIFQSENESNDEDYSRSPVLLDLDENSKQQQRKVASIREANSPSSAPTINQQDQGLAPGIRGMFCTSKYKESYLYQLNINFSIIISSLYNCSINF